MELDRTEAQETQIQEALKLCSSSGEGNGNPLHALAGKIPGTEEPGGLPSMGSHTVGHD